MKEIERDSRKSEAGRERATNKPKCTMFKAQSEKVMKDCEALTCEHLDNWFCSLTGKQEDSTSENRLNTQNVTKTGLNQHQ